MERKVRGRQLSGGWYPLDAAQARRRLEAFLRNAPAAAGEAPTAAGGIVPHAGWDFSGEIAARVFASLRAQPGTVAIVGGHLPPGAGVLAAFEEAYETPLGELEADLELLRFLRERLSGRFPLEEDRRQDNTVEVNLPMVRHFFPGARALWLRAEPGPAAVALGEALAAAAREGGRRLRVVGSTDLTHYGPAYGFTPQGGGAAALDWVREVNDRRVIEPLLALRLDEALERARREGSACSIGGAVAAAAFARAEGAVTGALLRYRTSHELHPSPSFVGYAGIVYPAP